MDREELAQLIRDHNVNGIWCYGCNKQVGTRTNHLVDMLMPAGVDYLLQAREI